VMARAAGAAEAACEVTRRGLVPCRQVFAGHIPSSCMSLWLAPNFHENNSRQGKCTNGYPPQPYTFPTQVTTVLTNSIALWPSTHLAFRICCLVELRSNIDIRESEFECHMLESSILHLCSASNPMAITPSAIFIHDNLFIY